MTCPRLRATWGRPEDERTGHALKIRGERRVTYLRSVWRSWTGSLLKAKATFVI